jgi:hypothetical protein
MGDGKESENRMKTALLIATSKPAQTAVILAAILAGYVLGTTTCPYTDPWPFGG